MPGNGPFSESRAARATAAQDRPASLGRITPELARRFYEVMRKSRAFEERLFGFIQEGRLSGFYHPGAGHEAAQVGAVLALEPDDYMVYNHRGCAHLIAKGVPLASIFGDLLGTMAGSTRGKGAGIVHVADPALGVLGQSGTLGGCFPVAAGAGISAKYRSSRQVVLCLFGDGTANRGTFHEAVNVMALWGLPVVLLCENNRRAVSMSFERSTLVSSIADRAAAYGIPGVRVDGLDPEAVYQAVASAARLAREDGGPTLIEATVVRMRGHFEGDSQSYRSPEELEAERLLDPVPAYRKRILAAGYVTEDELLGLETDLRRLVAEQADAAAASPLPPPTRAVEDLYA